MGTKDRYGTLRLLYGAIQFFYWAGGSVALGFAVAFLQALGFGNAQAGTVSAFASLLGCLLMLAVSRRIDRGGAGAVYRWSWLLVLGRPWPWAASSCCESRPSPRRCFIPCTWP